MSKDIDVILNNLAKSNFRMKFHLRQMDFKYVQEKGLERIKEHAYDFIKKRLALKNPRNDGRQTPMRGHPVFIAQHATATCCRSCLEKWYKISKDRVLTTQEIDFIVDIIMAWIEKEMNKINLY